MSKNEGFVWENIFEDPARQENVDNRIAAENRRRAEREERLCQFHQANADRKRSRMEVQACRYATGALAAGAVAFLVGDGGIGWLAWILGIIAACLALISCFGFGRINEMDRAKRRAALRCARPEDGMQENTYIDTVTEEEDEVNAEYEAVY